MNELCWDGINLIITPLVPRDKIYFCNNYLTINEASYPKFIYATVQPFSEAVRIIKNFYLDQIERRVEDLKAKKIIN